MLFAESSRDLETMAAPKPAAVAELLEAYRYRLHEPATPEELTEFVSRFCGAWHRSTGSGPVPAAVIEMTRARDRKLREAWTRYEPGPYPAVAIVSPVGYANPFIVRAKDKEPLIVMSEGLVSFVFGSVLTSMLYAHSLADPTECLTALRQFMCAWLKSDPALAPDATTIQRLSTLDQSITTFAVGLSNCVLSWAFYHELAHLRLGHLGRGVVMAYSLPDGAVSAQTRTYAKAQEFAADAFGLDRYLALLEHEDDIRRDFEFGRQADHAPVIGLELMNLAYLNHPSEDRRISPTHPAPLDRAKALLERGEQRLSREGRDFYGYWRDLLAHVDVGLRSHPV